MRLTILSMIALLLAAPAQAGDLALSVTTAGNKGVTDAVIMVRPQAGVRAPSRLAGPYRMSQQDMQFHPFVLVVPVGAEVSFPNLDSVRHHVYSFSPAKTFELKLYSRDETRKVTFEHAGVVPLGCNIHDSMVAFIRVVDTPYAAKTGAAGEAALRDLPAGPAVVTVWHPYLKAPANEITRKVVIPASGAVHLVLPVELRRPPMAHGGY